MPESGEWVVLGYTHLRDLGSGASGRVVHAVRNATGARVAIKYLAPRLVANPQFLTRFRAEARMLATLTDPHVVRVFDYVESERGAAIVMELVDGSSLRRLLAARDRLEPEAALAILKGSLLGLAAAHAAGVVHRDYKPENVLVPADAASRLVDFGIAVPAGANAPYAGTPPYMAPEQWAGGGVDPATDVYAATVVFFECLTGATPYTATTLPEWADTHRRAPVPVAAIPAGLQDLVGRGMAKSPEQRPGSATAFVTELDAAAVAAYGSGWEARGRRALAGAAAAALATSVPAGLAAGGGGAAPAVVSGTSAGSTAGSGLLAPMKGSFLRRLPGVLGTKTGAAIMSGAAAAILVLGGGAVFLNHQHDAAAADAAATASPTSGTTGTASPTSGAPTSTADSASPTGTSGTRGAGKVSVPPLKGKSRDDAETALTDAGLKVGKVSKRDSKRAAGTVLSSTPASGHRVAEGTKVDLVVARGKGSTGKAIVPNVVGKSKDAAVKALGKAGFPVRIYVYNMGGKVTSQSPAGGTLASKGSPVRINVGKR